MLVIAAHGTTSAAGQATVHRLVEEVARQRPALEIALCFLDILSPGLDQTLKEHPKAVVVPALLSYGYHVAADIPAIAAGYPKARIAGHLGPDRALSVALQDRLGATTGPVLLVAGGSRLPEAAQELTTAAVDLAALTGRPVRQATMSEDVASRLHTMPEATVLPYLIAEGFFYDKLLSSCTSNQVAPVLGAHPALAELILRRHDQCG